MKTKLPEEPFRSPITDEERLERIAKVRRGEASASDAKTLAEEERRAHSKEHAAREQIAHPDDAKKALFANPDRSAESAMATVGTLQRSAEDWMASTQGHAYKNRQSLQAQQPRSRTRPIIGKLVHDDPEATAAELWLQFLGYEEQDFRVKDCGDHAKWHDTASDKKGKITRDAFEVAVSRAKKEVT